MTNNLTDKQKRFCEEYVIDWNATRSAIAAGYSEHTAQQIGYENLLKPYINEYIELIQQDLAKLSGVSALGNIITLKGIKDSDEARDTDRIKSVEVINKMLGYNAPDKNINQNDNTNLTTIINLGDGEKPKE